MKKFKQAFYRFMMGRYGTDTLGTVMLWVMMGAVILNTVLQFFDIPDWLPFLFYLLVVSLAGVSLFRMMSRNIQKRRRENEAFCKFFRLWKNRFRDRKTHVYRKCPHCRAVLRLPKSKGKHSVLCPRCHQRFQTKG